MSESRTPRVLGPKALEMIMRDVLGGMEELALMKGYQPGADAVEIIAIEPATKSSRPPAHGESRVVAFTSRRRKAG